MMLRRPLSGIRVVDVTEGAQGPFAASLLADLGASVVKIERPGGELMRRPAARPRKKGHPLPILSISRGRQASIVLDLTQSAEKARLIDLVRGADIFIENWKRGTADDLGLSFDDLVVVNDRLIYLSASGYGSSGPFAQLPSFGNIAAVAGGLASVSGEQGGLTENPRFALVDFVSAMVAAEMALAVLAFQSEGDHGVHAESSQLESAVVAMGPVITLADSGADRFAGGPSGASDRWVVPSSMFRCAAGEFIALHAESDPQWLAVREVLSLADVPSWQTLEGRLADADAVEAAIGEATSNHEASALVDELTSLGVPCCMVRRWVGDAMNDHRLSDGHIVWRRAGDEVGWIAMAQAPWEFDGNVRASWPCPSLGERGLERNYDHDWSG